MKQQLRAEIYESYIQMGLAGLRVDPDLYSLVRQRLQSSTLCGRHCKEMAELPSPELLAAKKKRARASKATAAADPTNDLEILAEEPPSKTNWRRYRVRWASYSPDWEGYRIPGSGATGTPIETYEPVGLVRKHYRAALQRWEVAKAAAAQA